ncbi:MAG: LamB/YcsF family protein [Acidobacteria bacterium]|nr:LamB/YcsF family protein [Acidobacteriota bacterium]
MAITIDLNADVGERPEALVDGIEAALLRQVTSVNIACGGHAGDAATMIATVRLALAAGTAIGAHPGYPDPLHFGRSVLAMEPPALRDSLIEQIRALAGIAAAAGAGLVHVKPHGALYNLAARDAATARLVAESVAAVDPGLVLVGLAGSALLAAGEAAGLVVAGEAFVERRYEADGTLRDRRHADALIHDPGEAAAQAVRIACDGQVTAVDGTVVPVDARTLCIHGDSPGAAAIAAAVRQALTGAGVVLAPVRVNR